MTHRSFLHGTFVLIASQLVTRILGFVYRIYLSRLIGASGMGLFSMIWPIAGLALTFVTAGLPVALSKLVAEAIVQQDRVRVERILRLSTAVIVSMSVVITLCLWFLRPIILHYWLTDSRAYPTYVVMIPIITIIAISSIYRGYFQGLQDMSPPAWQQIIETVVRIGAAYVLAGYFIRFSIAEAAAAAMGGTVLGELAGLLYLALQYFRRGRLSIVFRDAPRRSLETSKQTLIAIGEIAVPVTLSRLIWSVLSAIEPVLVTRSLLLAGVTTTAATAGYGEYSSMAGPLLSFPTVFTWSLAVNLVPSVSEAIAGRSQTRVRTRLAQSWRATAIVGFPASVVLTVLAIPLCRVIYHDATAGTILAVMAPVAFLLYLQAPLSGILQGLNKAGVSMVMSIIGGVVRLGLIYLLASRPQLGILGVAWATSIATVLTTGLYFASVYKYIGFAVRITDTIKIACASLLTLVLIEVLTVHSGHMTGGKITLVILTAIIFYFILCCSFRVVTSYNMKRIPKIGGMLARFVQALPFAV